jgi:hypothetical protein
MTRIKMLGLMVVAVFSLSAVAASTASALEWLDNGHPITNPILVLLVNTGGAFHLGDLAATGGSTEIECEGHGHGLVGPGPNDTIHSITATACKFVSGKNGSCEASKGVTAKAVHLPYITRLLTVAGVTRDMTEGTGGGAGYNVECTVAGIFKVQDECTTNTGDPKITNNTNDVISTFEANEKASCTQGNSTSGMVVGNTLIFSDVPGLKITVSG